MVNVSAFPFVVRCLALWVLTVSRLFSADPDYDTRAWRTDEGLPHNSVNAIVQDHAGYLWFATVGGIARFDGRAFKEFQLPLAYRSGGYNVRALVEERPGTMLIISASGDVLRIGEGGTTVHPITAQLAALKDAPAALFVDRAGALWVGTSAGRVARVDPTGPTVLMAQGQPVVQKPRRFTFAVDENGETWVAVSGYLAVFRGGDLQPYPESTHGRLITPRRAGGFWICDESHLARMERGTIVEEASEVPWQNSFSQLREVLEDGQGVPWIALTRSGLFRFAKNHFAHIPTPYASTSCLAEDSEGSIWVGTGGDGVLRLRTRSHHLIDHTSGLTEDLVSSLCEDPSGRIWLANRTGGVVAIAPGSIALHEEFHQPPFANVVAADSKGKIWFGGGNRGLLVAGPDFSQPIDKMPVPENGLHLVFCAKDGDVWFAGDRQHFGFYRAGLPRLLGSVEGFDGRTIRSIAQDPAGDIWMASQRGGLLRWDGARIEAIGADRGAPDQPINDLVADGPGNLWIATTEGLVRRENGAFHTFTKADGLADDLLIQVVEDDFGRLWLGARSGLFVVSKAELHAVARGQLPRVSSRLYGRDEGLVGFSPISDYYPRCLKGQDGRLWFATLHGAVVVSPALIGRDRSSPPLLIDEVRLDGQKVSPAASLRFPVGAHRLEIQFAAPSFLSPENVQVSYRLDGIDVDWLDAGPERAANLVNLPSGRYHLSAVARHRAASASSLPVEFSFVITPAWWETSLVRLSALLLLTGLTAWLVRMISQRALKARLERLEREHALEKERARIARDLHDELGSGLTELGLLADRISDSRPAEIPALLRGFGGRTRRLAAELSSIVWTMSSANGQLDALAIFIRQYAQRLFRHTGTTCTVTGVEAMPALTIAPGPQQQLLATVKEALNNVIKHAQATRAQITLKWEKEMFEILIQDNGVGFDVAAKTADADGNGLRNMRSRAAESRGTVTLESTPHDGTRLLLRFPVSSTPPPSPSPPLSSSPNHDH